LENELETTARTWKFVLFHHPPYFRLPPFEDYDTRLPVRAYLVPLFERAGVQAVFNSHVHFYERSRKRGIYYIVTGGGGAYLSTVGAPQDNPYSIYAASLYHFCRVEVDGSSLACFARDTAGAAFDSFTLDLESDEDGDGYLDGDEFSSAWDPTDPYSPPPASLISGDYDGDGTAEVALFRPASGLWAVRGLTRFNLGRAGDCPVPADYDGDGRPEAAIFRIGSGLWSVRDITRFYFGGLGDLPRSADYSGDGTVEPVLFRAASGLWAVRGITRVYFGAFADYPAPADYDGDGAAEEAVFRPDTGLWAPRGLSRSYFGRSSDLPVSR